MGTHRGHWLWETDVRLFVARQQLDWRATLAPALGPWALDSGGFTEIDKFGEWRTSPTDYVLVVERFVSEIGGLEWVAPQDWMCEPHMLARTGLDVPEHQLRTVRNFVWLRDQLGELVVPVLQGWTLDDYLRCAELYGRWGVDLERERLVGLGTVCRRQSTREAAMIVRRLAGEGFRLHGFGVKLRGLDGRFAYADALASCDSLAWSAHARMAAWKGLPSCDPSVRKACNNCLHYALEWRDDLLPALDPDQKPLWKEAPA